MKKILVTLYLLASSSIIYAQMPTPTAFPPATELLIVVDPADWQIWNFTDEAIQVWNFEPNLGLVIQVSIIIILVVAYVAMLIKLIQQLMDKD